jgi:hypothetical protein
VGTVDIKRIEGVKRRFVEKLCRQPFTKYEDVDRIFAKKFYRSDVVPTKMGGMAICERYCVIPIAETEQKRLEE